MNSSRWFLFISLAFSFHSCLEDQTMTDHALIQSKLKKDLEAYRVLKWYDCTNTIILDAEAYVDTFLLVENVNASLEDGLMFPARPQRPPYIGYILLDDTTKKTPILNYLESKRKKRVLRDTNTHLVQ